MKHFLWRMEGDVGGAGAILAMASDLRYAWGFFNQPVFQGN